VDLELPGRIFQSSDDVNFQPGSAGFINLGRHDYDQAIGKFDFYLTEIRSHRRIDDGPAVELQQRLGNAPKVMQRDVGHSDLS
jgi:hypothetical protein